MWNLRNQQEPKATLHSHSGGIFPMKITRMLTEALRPQMWDLRNQREPKATLHSHSGGVLGLSWCPQDPAFLLSSGKDNR